MSQEILWTFTDAILNSNSVDDKVNCFELKLDANHNRSCFRLRTKPILFNYSNHTLLHLNGKLKCSIQNNFNCTKAVVLGYTSYFQNQASSFQSSVLLFDKGVKTQELDLSIPMWWKWELEEAYEIRIKFELRPLSILLEHESLQLKCQLNLQQLTTLKGAHPWKKELKSERDLLLPFEVNIIANQPKQLGAMVDLYSFFTMIGLNQISLHFASNNTNSSIETKEVLSGKKNSQNSIHNLEAYDPMISPMNMINVVCKKSLYKISQGVWNQFNSLLQLPLLQTQGTAGKCRVVAFCPDQCPGSISKNWAAALQLYIDKRTSSRNKTGIVQITPEDFGKSTTIGLSDDKNNFEFLFIDPDHSSTRSIIKKWQEFLLNSEVRFTGTKKTGEKFTLCTDIETLLELVQNDSISVDKSLLPDSNKLTTISTVSAFEGVIKQLVQYKVTTCILTVVFMISYHNEPKNIEMALRKLHESIHTLHRVTIYVITEGADLVANSHNVEEIDKIVQSYMLRFHDTQDVTNKFRWILKSQKPIDSVWCRNYILKYHAYGKYISFLPVTTFCLPNRWYNQLWPFFLDKDIEIVSGKSLIMVKEETAGGENATYEYDKKEPALNVYSLEIFRKYGTFSYDDPIGPLLKQELYEPFQETNTPDVPNFYSRANINLDQHFTDQIHRLLIKTSAIYHTAFLCGRTTNTI